MESNIDFVLIDPEQLKEETLLAIITSFILREGTDYGANEITLDTKQRQIKTQIENDKIKIVYDPSTESLTLLTTHEYEKIKT